MGYTKEYYPEFGEFLKNMREAINWTQEQMAEALGVFRTTIKRWEEGKHLTQQDLYLLELQIRDVTKAELNRKKAEI